MNYKVNYLSEDRFNSYDAAILLEPIDEELLINKIKKGAVVIDAIERSENETEYHTNSFYKKIRIIALTEK